MSSPIPIPISYASRTDASSPGLYIPIHRRNLSMASSYTSSSSRTPSPSPVSSRALSPSPTSRYVYTPADLLSLSRSPLAQLSMVDMDVQLRAIAPEVVQTRKQRKASAWHAHQPTPTTTDSHRHRTLPRRGSHTQTSESEEDRASTWRRV